MIPAEHLHGPHTNAIPVPATTPAVKVSDVCRWCDQPIPPEKLEEVSGKIRAREHQHADELSRELRQQFARQQADAQTKAKEEMDRVRSDAAATVAEAQRLLFARESAIREQVRQDADAHWQATLQEVARERSETESALRNELAQAQHAKKAAEKERRDFADRLAQVRLENESTLRQAREDFELQAERIRGEAAQAAEAEVARRVAERERGADARVAELAAQLRRSEQHRENAVTEAASKLEDATRQRLEAEEARRKSEQEAHALKESHDAVIRKVVEETREAADVEKDKAVQTERAKNFNENQKWQLAVKELQRKLERKNSDELGEGAEIDLFESLKHQFPSDLFERVKKGVAGADIIHTVREQGQVCGRIVYDSKNRESWRHDHATKLRADQIAAKADHAVLACHKFPTGTKQLHAQDGVIIACPARVLAVVSILRDHIVQMHQLRASTEAREGKTAELYEFITSERCTMLFDSIEVQIEKIEQVDADEADAHKAVWAKRGRLLKAAAQAQGNLRFEISKIIGTASRKTR